MADAKNFGPTLEFDEWKSMVNPSGWWGQGTDPKALYAKAAEDYERAKETGRVIYAQRLGTGGPGSWYGPGVGPEGGGSTGGGGGPAGGTRSGSGGGVGAGGSGGGGSGSFNLNPTPRSGNGPYGLVPGALGLPDPYGDLKRVLPDLDALNSRTSGAILDQLGGNLSPETEAALTNLAAERGVAGGMPGAQTWAHLLLGNVAGGMETLKQQGIANYSPFMTNVSQTQTVSPELQATIANQNAINAAAPDPAAAASEAERLFNKYRQSIGAPGGGGSPGGGTRSSAPTFPSIQSFVPTAGSGTTAPAPTTTVPGWGEAWNNQGGSASVGNVPNPQAPFNYDAWEGATNYGPAAGTKLFDWDAWENP